MGMTPEKARKTWCPHGRGYLAEIYDRDRTSVQGIVIGNRLIGDGDGAEHCACLADLCQMWEFDVEWTKPGKVLPAKPRKLPTGDCRLKK